jgi:hypothetical protein
MKAAKATYTNKSNFALPSWITLRQVYVLKSSFLAIYNAEIDDAKTGATSVMPLHIEYPKRLLPKFKKHFGLS